MKKLNVGILVFDDVEVLDFCGPFEVFSRTRLEPGIASRQSDASAPFEVFTVARDHEEPITAIGGLQFLPDISFKRAPAIDVLVVPGGYGTRGLIHDAFIIDWIKWASIRARVTCSVCTGALLLAKAGLLDGRRATTHWGALELLPTLGKRIKVVSSERYVDDGIVTSAGVSAGIDMALYLVDRLCGPDVATDTARYMDYRTN